MGREVYAFWRATATRAGQRPAIISPDGKTSLSCADVLDRVESFIANNPEVGGWRGRVVAFQFRNCVEWLEAFLVCQKTEALALPVDADVPPRGVRHILQSVKPVALWNSTGIHALINCVRRPPACLIKMTSGSTGTPRFLVFEDALMIADGKQIIDTMKLRPCDRNLAAIPLGHSYGLGNLVMPLMIQGNPVCLCDDPFPHGIARTIRQSEATVFPAVPALLNALTRANIAPDLLARLRLVISAGSPLTPDDARAFHERFGHRIHNFYGSSETGGIAYDRTGEDTLAGSAVGTPLSGVRVASSPSGRLWVSSPAVFQRGNRRKSTGNGSFLLPDYVQVMPDGRLQLIGRESHLVKIGSRRLNPAEIEKHIRSHEGVEAAFVNAAVDDSGRVRLVAAFVGSVPAGILQSHVAALLPAWKRPARWLRLPAIPITSRGKIDLRRIRKQSVRLVTPRDKA